MPWLMYWVTASSAVGLASSLLTPPPTPSATIMRKASRSGPAVRLSLSQAGQADLHLLLQGTDEEVLVLGADLSLMGDPVDIDLLVVRLALGSCGRRCGHGDLESAAPASIPPATPRFTCSGQALPPYLS